ncbi:MAG TPA: ACT domain-containing protein [Phycisphaerae bacterium]|nr:ACT domain-containing protein [Phycisphaerae bacterium]
MPTLIVSALGPDRPGLVGQLTGTLHGARANILDSRMVNLRGQFAVLLLVDVPDAGRLAQELPAAAKSIGLHLSITPQAAPAKPIPGIPFKLKTYSLDQPGLVHRVSEVLRTHGVNIEDLAARQESAPFAGDPLFIMEMRLTVPPTVTVKALRADLEAVCDQLNADLDLEPAAQ